MSRITTCPIFSLCGLCQQLPLSIQEEAQQKQVLLKNIFHHDISWVESPLQQGYRHRISLKSNKEGILGYYKPKTHDLIPIQQCMIALPAINKVLHNLQPSTFSFTSVEFRSNGNKVIAQLNSLKRRKIPHKKAKKWLLPYVDAISIDQQHIHGDPFLDFTIADVHHRFHPKSFFQINMSINQILVEQIISLVAQKHPSHILDLYAGAGNIGLALAKKGHHVTMMESAPTSIQDARNTAKRNNLNVHIVEQRVEDHIPGSIFYDFLILDPPRAGCGKKILDFILTTPAHVLYVSCNPNSLKKDVALLLQKGYRIEKIIGYNMFPGTTHLETLCLLSK